MLQIGIQPNQVLAMQLTISVFTKFPSRNRGRKMGQSSTTDLLFKTLISH